MKFSSFQKLTFDVICSSCFGIQTDSIKNPNDPFVKTLQEFVSFDVSIGILLIRIFEGVFLILKLEIIVNYFY